MDLRTKDIKISNENPFEHDLLKRDKYVNNLTQIVKNTKGGFTLSINADWGYGKTTLDDKTTLLLNHFIDMAVQGYGWLAA